MNIFILHNNPTRAAQMQCDKHVVKMILESCQMLSTIHHLHNSPSPYKPTHKNHPCTVWARECRANYVWLVTHALALCKEYTYRYGKKHKSEDIIAQQLQYPPATLPILRMTPFALAMPEEYKCNSAVKSYRTYYIRDKASIAKWTKRKEPKWFTDGVAQVTREYCS